MLYEFVLTEEWNSESSESSDSDALELSEDEDDAEEINPLQNNHPREVLALQAAQRPRGNVTEMFALLFGQGMTRNERRARIRFLIKHDLEKKYVASNFNNAPLELVEYNGRNLLTEATSAAHNCIDFIRKSEGQDLFERLEARQVTLIKSRNKTEITNFVSFMFYMIFTSTTMNSITDARERLASVIPFQDRHGPEWKLIETLADSFANRLEVPDYVELNGNDICYRNLNSYKKTMLINLRSGGIWSRERVDETHTLIMDTFYEENENLHPFYGFCYGHARLIQAIWPRFKKVAAAGQRHSVTMEQQVDIQEWGTHVNINPIIG